MWQDPYTLHSTKDGCDACHYSVPSCYAVEFLLFPKRLMRKRHRDLEQKAVYCRSCYETDADFPILVNGRPVSVRKYGITFNGCDLTCRQCGGYFRHNQRIFGMVASSLWMSGSCIESAPLAIFCPDCVEKLAIALSPKI